MKEGNNRVGKTTVAFDGTLLAVDKSYWSNNGANWNSTSKLLELQPPAKQKLSLGNANAWIAFPRGFGTFHENS